MKNAIITSCDEKFGNFLINNWLKSLKDNSNLKNIDLIIMDYGLSNIQKEKLLKEKVKIIKCKRDGHVNIIRLRDISNFLKKNKYDKVICCDGGDIIFQKDIRLLFKKNAKLMVAKEMDSVIPMSKLLLSKMFKEKRLEVLKYINGKIMINAGFIFGKSEEIIKMYKKCFSISKDKSDRIIDEISVNYYLYKNGFSILPKGYNFMPPTSGKKFKVKNGIFMFENENKIAVVHNVGGTPFLRAIKNFGYGADFNKISKKHLIISKIIHNLIKHFQ